MSTEYTGGQFDYFDYRDPSFLDEYDEQDIELALEHAVGDETHGDHQLSESATSPPRPQRSPPRPLNPEAIDFLPSTPRYGRGPPQSFGVERTLPARQTPEWHGNPIRSNVGGQPMQMSSMPDGDTGWSQNNRFAPLTPDWTPYIQWRQEQLPYTPMHAQCPQETYLPAYNYPSPPNTREYNGSWNIGAPEYRPSRTLSFQQANTTTGPSVAERHETLSMSNLSSLPARPPEINTWNLQSYNLGDRNSQATLEPPSTPTHIPRSRYARRGSAATSALTSNLSCEICEKQFNKQHALDHHRRWHGDRPNACGVCGKSFVAAKDLRRHVKTHNKEERHLFCNIIGCCYHHRGFQRKDHLKRHMEKRHPGGLLSPPNTSTTGRSTGMSTGMETGMC